MTKRARPEESQIELPSDQECDNSATAGGGETASNQVQVGEQSATSGGSTPPVVNRQFEELPHADVAAEELLAASPFWALLLRAGYTWW